MRIEFAGRGDPPPDEVRAILAALDLIARERAARDSRPGVPAWRFAARNPELDFDELRLLAGR